MKRPRFLLGTWRPTGNPPDRELPMQQTRYPRDTRPTIPEPIARLAWEEYDRRFPGQEFEDFFLHRGGFGDREIIYLLADLLERERGRG